MPEMPYIIVLKALKDGLFAALEDAEVDGKPVLVRHHRHRESKATERPCIAIRFVSSDPATEQRQEDNDGMPEEIMSLAVNLVIDVDIPPEADELAPADLDPTGFEGPSLLTALALDYLFPGVEANKLGGTVWDMSYDGTAAEEGDATPDYLRIEERLTLLYRVRADQPTILLTGE